MKFTLTIDLGNEAMQSQQDVKAAILRTFSVEDAPITLHTGDNHPVHDVNGNTVGKWEVTDDDPDYADAPAHPDGSNEPLKHFYHP